MFLVVSKLSKYIIIYLNTNKEIVEQRKQGGRDKLKAVLVISKLSKYIIVYLNTNKSS